MNSREKESCQHRLMVMGCDVEDAVRRLGNDRDFYTHLFTTFIRERSWEDISFAMENGDYESAFESAHMLKGTAVTLGLTPLTDRIISFMNELRSIRDEREGDYEEKAQIYYWDLMEMIDILSRQV